MFIFQVTLTICKDIDVEAARQCHWPVAFETEDLSYNHSAAVTIGTHNRPICSQAVLNRLRGPGIHPRRAYIGPELTDQHRQVRLRWCQHHSRWLARDWNRVLFTDELKFTLQKTDGRLGVLDVHGGMDVDQLWCRVG